MTRAAILKAAPFLSCLAVTSWWQTSLMPATAARQNPTSDNGQDSLLKIAVQDRQRSCLIHTPPGYDGKQKLPLLLCLHGGMASYHAAIKSFDLNQQADRHSFIVAYPNGSSRFGNRLATWNSGGCCGYAKAHNIDDIAFIKKLIATLQENYAIDNNKLYVVGFSHGGTLAYRLAAALPGVFAGIGAISGFLNEEKLEITEPVSVFIVHGSDDKSVPMGGGSGKWQRYGVRLNAKPLQDTVNFWVQADGCNAQPQITKTGAVTEYFYAGGKNNTSVELVLLAGGGHAWPGGNRSWLFATKPFREFSANEALWRFFTR